MNQFLLNIYQCTGLIDVYTNTISSKLANKAHRSAESKTASDAPKFRGLFPFNFGRYYRLQEFGHSSSLQEFVEATSDKLDTFVASATGSVRRIPSQRYTVTSTS